MAMLGHAGEKLVCSHFRNKGCEVTESPYTYDDRKDMIINGLTAEVKTQQLFHTEDAFSVEENQLRKCENADLLIFVEAPNAKISSENNVIRIYGCDNKKKRKFYERITRNGKKMKLIKRGGLTLLKEITDERLIEELLSLSNSDWGKK